MIIRQATSDDIPAIVELLKSSLGDISSKKSVAYWNWKHVNNPFGPSPVLVAEKDGVLTGVRAMMCWDWSDGRNLYRSLRAVDTATHPDYQGKGIFKQLTLQLVEEAKENGYDFIYNSPNSQSAPGYLKMGWEVWGKMPFWVRSVVVFHSFQESVFSQYHEKLLQTDFSKLIFQQNLNKGIKTVVSSSFLKWRYQDCPVKKYGLEITELNGNKLWLFFSVKKQKIGYELRACHFFFSNQTDESLLLHSLSKIAQKLGCQFITLSGIEEFSFLRKTFYGWVKIKFLGNKITIRELSNSEIYLTLKKRCQWFPQTGDMELF